MRYNNRQKKTEVAGWSKRSLLSVLSYWFSLLLHCGDSAQLLAPCEVTTTPLFTWTRKRPTCALKHARQFTCIICSGILASMWLYVITVKKTGTSMWVWCSTQLQGNDSLWQKAPSYSMSKAWKETSFWDGNLAAALQQYKNNMCL